MTHVEKQAIEINQPFKDQAQIIVLATNVTGFEQFIQPTDLWVYRLK